jgi:hypothetical protein
VLIVIPELQRMQLMNASHARRLAVDGPPKQINQAFVIILGRITRQIAKAVSHRHMSTVYSVPPVLFGYPTFDMVDAVHYLRVALTNKGYSVTAHKCGVLAIFWTDGEDTEDPEAEPDRFNIDL